MIPAILIVFFLFFPWVIEGTPYEWGISLYCHKMLAPLIGFSMFKYVPRSRVKLRSIIVCALLFILIESQIDLIYFVSDYNFYYSFYLLCLYSFVALFMYVNVRKYQYKSDPIEKDNVFLCFHKPITLRMFICSLFGLPFGGLCVYVKDRLYGYKIHKKTFQRCDVSPNSVQRKFIVVDTGIKCSDAIIYKLNRLIGSKAGCRVNCIWTLKPVLDMLGPRFSPKFFELIPPTYSIKVLHD